jgi:uncharacterized membrane protein
VLPIARNPAKLAQLAELEGRMIWWAAVAGALIGWSVSYSGAFGFILGGLAGAGLGAWLRSEVRREIRDAVNQALAARPAAAAERWDGAGVVAESEPATPPSAMARAATPPPAVAEPLDQPWREELAAARDVREREYVPPEPSGPSAAEELVGRVRDWFLGGNTILRVGLVILFVGLVFLARLVGGIIPLEGRLALVGLAGAALLGFGLYKRLARPDYALHLQGAGVAVMYLTVYAAAKVWPVLPPGIAFGFMVVIASLGAALAVLQNSQTLALASFLGGYAVPVLLGGESKTPLPLFSYLTILNLAVLGIAWKKSWRPLNLLGFFASFGIATLWGLDRYSDQHFLICELFLAATVAIYLATAVLYAHNTPGKLGNFADSTLLFGTALTGFGLQAGMVHDRPYAAAWSALGFGAVYLGVTAWTMRRKDPAMRLMNESMLAIGVGFVTMAIPLALEAKWTSAAWALEGAGAFWVGSRQARWMPRAFGMTLQVLAALILFTTMQANISAVPFANNGFVGPLLIALPLLFTAWLLRTQQPHSGSAMAKGWAPAEFGLRHVWFLAGFFFAALALLHEITRALPAVTADGWPEPVFHWWQKGLLAMLAILGLMALFDRFGRAKDWATATWPGRASIAVLVLGFLYALLNDRSVLDLPDLIAWIAALGLHYRLLQRQDRAGIGRRWNGAVHTIGALLLTAMLAQCLFELIDRADLWNTSWAGVVFLIAGCAMLALLTRWAGRAAPAGPDGLGWPLDPHARAYWWRAGAVLAAMTWIGALSAAWFAEGVSDPLPYVPLLNPIDLSVALAFVALALWRQLLGTAKDLPRLGQALAGNLGLGAGAVLAFVAVNGIWVRTAHHFMGVPWDYTTLSSPTVLTGFSILWTLMAMGLMLFALRRAMRVPWLAGAVLLGVVVAKLLFVDMGQAEGWARIVAFIGVGVLMLLIGYFVPLPPRKGDEEPPRKGDEAPPRQPKENA